MLSSIKSLADRFVLEEDGATMAEYALVLALVGIVCIAAVHLIGTNANSTFKTAANAL